MSEFLQRSLVSVTCLAVLSACSGDSTVATSAAFAVVSMSNVEVGFQTFQPRDLNYDGIVPNIDDSRYVYKNRASTNVDNSTSIVFNSSNASNTQTEDLVILAITDINDLYSALNIEDVTINVNGTDYTGDYVLIQEKSSGNLYPVVLDNTPLLSSEMTSTFFWRDLHRASNIADDARLYIDNSSLDTLSVFELSNGLFGNVDEFNYTGNSFWINEGGDILTQSLTDNNSMSWLDRSTLIIQPQTLTGPGEFLPLLYDGRFFATNTNDDRVYSLFTDIGGIFPRLETEWLSVPDTYVPTSSSAKRGNYEMTENCELYQFSDSTESQKSITYINDFSANNGQLAIAGQNSLFCVHATSASNTALPIITQFNIITEIDNTFAASEGTLLDASTRLTVISDDQVMFSDLGSASASFNEYYINVIDGSEEVFPVTESSIVGLQTLDN